LNQITGSNSLGLKLIGAFKFACGLLLVALGIGLFRGAKGDPAEEAVEIVSALKLDPENHYIHTAIEWVSGIKPGQLKAIGAGTFLYSLLYLVEGGGLLLRKHWAEYLTVVATGLFIPLEVYEVAKRPSALRIGLLAVNVAIVVYLIYQLMKKEGKGAPPDPGSADSII
jgi:uncharacterized membrane protein (DUF2068 family)